MIFQSFAKRILGPGIAAALGILAAAAPLAAQGKSGAPGMPVYAPHKGGDALSSQLKLTADQSKKVNAVLASRKPEREANMKALRDAWQSLNAAAAAVPPNERAIRAAAQALRQAEGDAALSRARINAEILPILDARQKEEFARMNQRPVRGFSRRGPAAGPHS